MVGQIIYQKIATLHELQTVYSLEDLYIMYEAIAVPMYNEYTQIENMKREVERKRKK